MRVYGSVSASALRHNLSIVRKYSPESRIMAVVKANGYGHGIIRVAKALTSDVESFAVATVDEAVELRDAGIDKPICLLSGFFSADQITDIKTQNIDCVIYCDDQIDILQSVGTIEKIRVWIKINTGMNRLGFLPQNLSDILLRIKSLPHLELRGVMSHFASADELDSDFTAIQIERFRKCTRTVEVELSMANSAGIMNWPDSHLDCVRPGIMLYGASPFPEKSGHELGLRPVMNLFSTIIAVNHLQPGEGIGYGLTWSSTKEIRVGIVGCGYGDGYIRNASPGAQVLIDGIRADIIGRVSMDSLGVDLSRHPNAGVGTTVKLFGGGLPVEEVATSAGTIPYEVLTSVNPRSVSLVVD